MSLRPSWLWETATTVWLEPGVSEFMAAIVGGLFAMGAQYLALRHDRQKDEQRDARERDARAWSIYFKISQAHEALTATALEIREGREKANRLKVELWQTLQFPPHDWGTVNWTTGELVLLIESKQFELMQRYQEAMWWLSNMVQSVKCYREMRIEFLRATPSRVDGDLGTVDANQEQLRAMQPTIAHLNALANSLERVLLDQGPDVRKLLVDYSEAMQGLCGQRPSIEFRDAGAA